MKTKNKALLMALCAVLLVVASVFGTVAYLTSQASVTNTFTVGNIAMDLDELDVDNDPNTSDNTEYGEGEDATTRDKANSYKLLPGQQYIKDPIVHILEKSDDCYLFVKVVNEITDIEDATTVAAQMEENGWVPVEGAENIYVYVGTDEGASAPLIVSAGSNIPVFETIKIKDSVTNGELAEYADKTITVTAYAVQKDGFEGETASTIWDAAFDTTAQG